jgi:hypothetical protein
LNTGDVPAEADDGGIGDAADPLGGEGLQLADGISDAIVLTAPFGRIILLHVGVEDEDVLVHVRRPELGRINRTQDGIDRTHFSYSFRSTAETLLVSGGTCPGDHLLAWLDPHPWQTVDVVGQDAAHGSS